MAGYYENMIKELIQLNQIDEAQLYYDSLTKLCNEKLAASWFRRIAADLSFAAYYSKTDNLKMALQYVDKARKLSVKHAKDPTISEIDYLEGNIYFKLKNYTKALSLYKSAEPRSHLWFAITKKEFLQNMAKCYAANGQWQLAFEYYDKYAPLSDSLYAEGTRKSLAEAEGKYQNKEKQLQIDTQNERLAYAAKQRFWLIGGLALAGLVAILLVVIYRNKKRTADILDEKNMTLSQLNSDLEEANQTKAKLFGIISHDLRSPINQVYQFLKLQQMAPDKLSEEQRNKLSHKIQSATGSLLETMEDLLLWSKTQMNQFKTDMQPVAVEEVVGECLQLLQLNIEAKNIQVHNKLSSEIMVQSDPYFLQTILQNLLQNAIKAAPENGELFIDYDDHNLSIQNNGGHFSQQQYEAILASKEDANSLSGLGLRLVDELSKKINAKVNFAAATADTTEVSLRFS